MANIYIALNGDDVGSKIGEAIANDDHEGLAATSSAVEGAHGNIDQWIESVGGKKITRSGDEGIYIIPEKALGDLESIKGSYKEQSGHGLTVGVGSSMSEASKALIYGKLNGKDQIVHYEPSIEDYLSNEDVSEDEIPQDDSMDSDQDADQEMPSEEGEDDKQDSGNAQMAAKKPVIPSVEADGNPDEADGEDDQDDSKQSEEQSDDEGFQPIAGDEENDEEDSENDEEAEGEDQENDEQEANPEETGGEEVEQAPPGEDAGDDNQKASESPEDADMPMADADQGDQISEEEDTQDPDAPGSQALDGDIDGEDFGADKDGSEAEAQESEAGDQPPMGEAPQGESTYKDLNEDDLSNPDMDLGNESEGQGDEQNQNDDALTSMIHGDMQDDSEDQMSGDENAPQGGSQLDEELRQDIASALIAFKENKDMLEQAREQNPKLYQATITMLRSMIEMAKKLGQNPEQDMQDQENEQQLNEEFPAADEAEGENPDEQGSPDVPAAKPDAEGMSSGKKQQGKLQ